MNRPRGADWEIDWEGTGPCTFIERYWVCKQEMRSAVVQNAKNSV
jgi:hypothetical protein